MKFFYITFRSVTYAQRGASVLEKGGFRATVLRTPRWMEEQGCGYCLRLWSAEISGPVGLLRQEKIPMRKVYIQNQDGILEEWLP
jgi:hypothetical protein